ncbi:MAG TPA: purine-nucleoside phosphorylase [Ignavibacteria bacterium]|nr:purine-nucleoside phosphorylase [Ignavibacteria bacterium]
MSAKYEDVILTSVFIKSKFPKNFKPDVCLIVDDKYKLPGNFKFNNSIDLSDIPHIFSINIPPGKSSLTLAKIGSVNLLIYRNRLNFYDGYSMDDIGHIIYALKFSGIKKILSIESCGYLNPRFSGGEISVVYDHINLMGDNPLIGKNDSKLGVRFPDMSDCYSKKQFDIISSILLKNNIKANESVYVGLTGPSSETDAEARFYREIGGDVAGYSLIPENITAVHCGLKFSAIALLDKNLVADVMMEDKRSEKEILSASKKDYQKANKLLNSVLETILYTI